MTQEAECEKTRAPNYLFCALVEKTAATKWGACGCAEHLESDDVLLGAPLTGIYKHNSPGFFFSHSTSTTLPSFAMTFPQMFRCNGRKQFKMFTVCLFSCCVCVQLFPSEVSAANHLPPNYSLLPQQLTLRPVLPRL